MRVIKLQIKGFSGPMIFNHIDHALEEICNWLSNDDLTNSISKDTCVGDQMVLTIGEMTEEELENLPEFEGF